MKKPKTKEEIEILQSETHNDDLSVIFIKIGGKYYCSIDWGGGEMKFELNFLSNSLDSYAKAEVSKALNKYKNGKEN